MKKTRSLTYFVYRNATYLFIKVTRTFKLKIQVGTFKLENSSWNTVFKLENSIWKILVGTFELENSSWNTVFKLENSSWKIQVGIQYSSWKIQFGKF